MMQNVINSVKRLNSKDKLNILTGCHGNEKYISLLCKTGHNFYVWEEVGKSEWKDAIEKSPSNLTVISNTSRIVTSFDAIMCHERTSQYEHVLAIANRFCLPMIMVDHCSQNTVRPHNVLESVNGDVESLKNRKANVVVASNDLCSDWQHSSNLNITIPTSVDLYKFKKDNDKRNGSTFFESELTPTRITVDNNVPRPVTEELFRHLSSSYSVLPTDCDIEEKEVIYQATNYFMHTYKNITVKVLEAMASENVVICMDTPEMRGFFEDDIDAILIGSPQQLQNRLLELDNDIQKREKIGSAARKKVEKICKESQLYPKVGFCF